MFCALKLPPKVITKTKYSFRICSNDCTLYRIGHGMTVFSQHDYIIIFGALGH